MTTRGTYVEREGEAATSPVYLKENLMGLAEIKNGRIVIEIPIDTLEYAARLHPDLYHHLFDDRGNEDETRIHVVDSQKFAEEIVQQLNREFCNGDTVVHKLLDDALLEAVENGAEGIFIKEIDS